MFFRKPLSIAVGLFIFLSLPFFGREALPAQDQGQTGILEPFSKGERVLILAPHPDDESIACSGVIQEALSKGAKVRVTFLTNGEHNEIAFIVYNKRITIKKNEFIRMGRVRRGEAIQAAKILGLQENDLFFLGYPDFGTFTIFRQYWKSDRPFKSALTRISNVPYQNAFSFGAGYVGENILSDLKKVILDYRPEKIFVSHPSDVNVDHKALYLFLQVALADLKGKINEPKVYPYLVHHLGWPLPRHYHPQLALNPPADLGHAQIRWLNFTLSPAQMDNKYKAVLCHRSQTASSAFYLLSFVRKNELFGDYPEIDLRQNAPAPGKNIHLFIFSKAAPNIPVKEKEVNKPVSEGTGRVNYSIEGDSLVINIEKPSNLVYRFSTMLYIFGYKYGKNFSAMPKIRIITRHDRFKVIDGKSPSEAKGISVNFGSSSLTFKVPLETLGGPDFVLSAVKAYVGKEEGGDSPVYSTGFRKLNLR